MPAAWSWAGGWIWRDLDELIGLLWVGRGTFGFVPDLTASQRLVAERAARASRRKRRLL